MSHSHNYPASVAEVIDDNMKFRPATLAAITRFKASDPWHGSLGDKIHKFCLLAVLCG
jgi:CO dehydrogenase/acetyl-CoA synthase epsilon subunit